MQGRLPPNPWKQSSNFNQPGRLVRLQSFTMSIQKQNIELANELVRAFDQMPLEGDADEDAVMAIYVARRIDPDSGLQLMKHIGGYNGTVDTLRQMVLHMCDEMPEFKAIVIEAGTTFASGGYYAPQGSGIIIVDQNGKIDETPQ